MGGAIAKLLFFQLLLLFLSCASHPLCTDSRAPFTTKTPLVFCPYNGSSCCDSVEDMQLQKLFQAMNIPDPACAFLLKSIFCAKCDQFAADLFKTESGTQRVPVLCTVSEVSTHSKGAGHDFCEEVWKSCQRTPLLNSPFSSSSQGKAQVPVNSTTKLTDFWNSKSAFCEAFGGSSDNGKVCFNGKPVSLLNTETPEPPDGVCLEKIFNGSYLDMVAHPDGSNRVFLSNLEGKIWLTTVPEEGSGETLVLDESSPFLDITDMVYVDTHFGLISMAFHPNFVQNGRFFVSFICDKLQGPGCSGRCSCNTDVDCDPSKLDSHTGVQPCQYNNIISEFTANGTTSQPSTATRANPVEVRRMFTMGIVYGNTYGGQILFGPDGYLYFWLGDGDDRLEAYNFAQNKKSLLGKVLRFDIDKLPSAKEIKDLNLWGNYSIPEDNPHSEDKELLPEIWALGFRHPWCCSFDSERPSYFVCPDAGKDRYEEVDIVTKGGNYGWRFYEGTTATTLSNPLLSSGTNTSIDMVNFIFPVMGYNHSAENTMKGSAFIVGGYFYRSKTDPCLYGRYLYTDLYGFAIWAGTENPENSGNFTTAKLSFSCAHDSPIDCNTPERSSPPILGYVFALGIDNRKDIFFLTSNGVLRVTRPSRCHYTCSKELKLTTIQTPTIQAPTIDRPRFTSTGNGSRDLQKEWLLVISLFLTSCYFFKNF